MYEHGNDGQLKELAKEEMEQVQGGLGYPDIGPWGVAGLQADSGETMLRPLHPGYIDPDNGI